MGFHGFNIGISDYEQFWGTLVPIDAYWGANYATKNLRILVNSLLQL